VGGAAAVEQWMLRPSTAVIAYNDLMAIGFLQAVKAAGWLVPRDVSVIGFDNIVDSVLVEPHVTTIAAPLISLAQRQSGIFCRGADGCPARPTSQSCCRPGWWSGALPGFGSMRPEVFDELSV